MSRDHHLFAGACIACQKLVQFTAPIPEYKAWLDGLPIQSAMPSLSEDDREFLITSLCGKCFDQITAEPDPQEELTS